MAYGKNLAAGIRVLLALLIVAGVFTVMGVIDIVKDANGSHRDFGEMRISEFYDGDVIGGTITETLGCALTEETTDMLYGVIPMGTNQTASYYVIPYFKTFQDVIPYKIILYRTGNSKQEAALEKLVDETGDWYSGTTDKTYTHILVEKAEVRGMDSEERQYFEEYLREYVDYCFDAAEADAVYDKFLEAVVPYVVQYSADTTIFVFIGIGIFAVLLIVVVIMFVLRKGRGTTVGTNGYTPAVGSNLYGEDPFAQNAAQQFGAGMPAAQSPYAANASGSDIGNMPAPPSNPFATKPANGGMSAPQNNPYASSGDIGNMPAPPSNPFATKPANGGVPSPQNNLYASSSDIGNMPAPASNPLAGAAVVGAAQASSPFASTMTNASSADISSMPAPPSNPFATKKSEFGLDSEVEKKDSLFNNPEYSIPAPASTADTSMDSLFVETAPEKQPEMDSVEIGLYEAPAPVAETPDVPMESLFPQTSKEDFVADNPFEGVPEEQNKTQSEFESLLLGDDN